MDTKTQNKNQYATYNICTNELKFFPACRLTDEEFETFTKKVGFKYYYGQKCFAGAWSVAKEDLIHSYGVDVAEDDRPDDVEARVNRFEKYAADHERSAEYAANRVDNATTLRRLRLAQNSFENETQTAAHWHERIAGAIRHANHKDNPGVIARRIKGLEADLRKQERSIKEIPSRVPSFYSDFQRAHGIDWDTKRDQLPEDLKAEWIEYLKSRVDSAKNHATRWIDHLNRRLEYERAYLDAVGGDPAAALGDLKNGDKVVYGGTVMIATKVSKVNVILAAVNKEPGKYSPYDGLKVSKTKLKPFRADVPNVRNFREIDQLERDPDGFQAVTYHGKACGCETVKINGIWYDVVYDGATYNIESITEA